jgi:hypothetical protein
MKLNEVKRLAETHTPAELQTAATAIENGEQPTIAVHGDDEGEMLTHLLGALDVHQRMTDEGVDFRTALREFTNRVRESIS